MYDKILTQHIIAACNIVTATGGPVSLNHPVYSLYQAVRRCGKSFVPFDYICECAQAINTYIATAHDTVSLEGVSDPGGGQDDGGFAEYTALRCQA